MHYRRSIFPVPVAAALVLTAWCGCNKSEPKGNVLAPALPIQAAPPAENNPQNVANNPQPNPAAPAGSELPLGRDIPAEPVAANPQPSAKETPAPEKAAPVEKNIAASKSAASPTPAAAPSAAAKAGAAQPAKAEPAKSAQIQPAAAKAKAPAESKTKLVIPQTAHVRVEVPQGLQQLLDEDPRMQPWVNKVINVADKCYARDRSINPFSKGVIAVKVTMHKNARPSGKPTSMPPLLAGTVACAEGELNKTKMPLFTGPEGQQYTVKIDFTR